MFFIFCFSLASNLSFSTSSINVPEKSLILTKIINQIADNKCRTSRVFTIRLSRNETDRTSTERITMTDADVLHDVALKTSAEIEIFQPREIALFSPVDYTSR